MFSKCLMKGKNGVKLAPVFLPTTSYRYVAVCLCVLCVCVCVFVHVQQVLYEREEWRTIFICLSSDE